MRNKRISKKPCRRNFPTISQTVKKTIMEIHKHIKNFLLQSKSDVGSFTRTRNYYYQSGWMLHSLNVRRHIRFCRRLFLWKLHANTDMLDLTCELVFPPETHHSNPLSRKIMDQIPHLSDKCQRHKLPATRLMAENQFQGCKYSNITKASRRISKNVQGLKNLFKVKANALWFFLLFQFWKGPKKAGLAGTNSSILAGGGSTASALLKCSNLWSALQTFGLWGVFLPSIHVSIILAFLSEITLTLVSIERSTWKSSFRNFSNVKKWKLHRSLTQDELSQLSRGARRRLCACAFQGKGQLK